MNCNYILENDICEKYLLGNLSVEGKSKFENHLAGCAACRQELEKQKFLISGVRCVGKQEMKSEIRRQVEEIKAQKQPPDWQMILKVAAVVFIMALIPSVIYYFQTDSGKPLSPVITNKQNLSEEDNSFAADQPAQRKQSSGGRREPTRSKDLADRDEQRQKQPVPAMPLAEQSVSEPDIESMAMGKAASPAESMAITAILQDSLSKAKVAKTLMTKSQLPKSAAVIDTNEINQDIAEGTKYYFAQLDKKKSHFDAEEKEALQMLDEVGAQKLAPNAGMQTGKLLNEGKLMPSTAVYVAGSKKITVFFGASKQEFRVDPNTRLPKSFNIQVLSRDSLDWEMAWQVNRGFFEYDPSQTEIVIEDQIMYLIIMKDYIYKANLKADSTEAVLIKKY